MNPPPTPTEKRNAKEKEMDAIIATLPKKTPDCSGEDGCTLITIVIELGDAGKPGVEPKIGHAGMGIGDDYYDFGPGDGSWPFAGSAPWWDNPDNTYGGGKPPANDRSGINLSHIQKHIERLAPEYTLQIQFCACKGRTARMKEYLEDLYKRMDSGDAPSWSPVGFGCGSAVFSAVAHGLSEGMPEKDVKGPLAPELLFSLFKNTKSNCGKANGDAATVTKLKGF
jgi:hypothetical protein